MRQPSVFAASRLSWHRSTPSQFRPVLRFIAFILLGLLLNWAGAVCAQTENSTENSTPNSTPNATPNPTPAPAEQTSPDRSAPPELLAVLANIDAAASKGDLATVMSFYDPAFKNSDGLTYDQLQQALQNFWQRFPNPTYSTQINSWKTEGDAIVAETTTTITATTNPAPQPPGPQPPAQNNPVSLTSTITSRQRFQGTKIVEQEILSEQSQLTQGENPPAVEVRLPEQVTVGQEFEFDAIVQEPLGDRLLLGAATDEQVQPSGYLSPTPVNLELLASGGLFKVGQAPAVPETHWVSATLIRDDGMTTITRRLQVVGN